MDGRHDSVDDVVDVGVIATRGAVAEDGNRLALADQFCEFVNREVRALSWTIDGEKTEAYAAQTVEMRVSVTEEFAGGFGCSVRRDRLADRVILAEGNV